MEQQPINHEDRNVPQPIRSDGAGAIDAGPRNMMRDIQNPNILVPPVTDEGMIPNLRFSFSDASHEIRSRRLVKRNYRKTASDFDCDCRCKHELNCGRRPRASLA